jgi:hypothetical protein
MKRTRFLRQTLGLGILSLALHGFVWQGWAQDYNSTLDITLSVGNTSEGEWHPTLIDTGSGYNASNVNYSVADASLLFHYLSVDMDPFISASVDVVNTTASVQTYTLIFTLPVGPIAGGSLMGGSVQGGLTDANGDGIGTLSTVGPGTALYFGRIDGINVQPLFADVKTISVSTAFGSASDSTSAGLPGPTIAGPSVATSIGIQHQFSLTPGDRATFSSVFVVVPVPEPGSLSLLALGGALLLWRRRR